MRRWLDARVLVVQGDLAERPDHRPAIGRRARHLARDLEAELAAEDDDGVAVVVACLEHAAGGAAGEHLAAAEGIAAAAGQRQHDAEPALAGVAAHHLAHQAAAAVVAHRGHQDGAREAHRVVEGEQRQVRLQLVGVGALVVAAGVVHGVAVAAVVVARRHRLKHHSNGIATRA